MNTRVRRTRVVRSAVLGSGPRMYKKISQFLEEITPSISVSTETIEVRVRNCEGSFFFFCSLTWQGTFEKHLGRHADTG